MCKDQITILLADDDADDQELLRNAILTVEPTIQVKLFNNGLEVMNYLNRESRSTPCLVVLDYNMPLVTGLEVLEKMALNPQLQTIPAIVWSTSNSAYYKQQCLTTGARRYIVKPADTVTYNDIAAEMVKVCCGEGEDC